ncbi:hypothetical protein D3C75_998300 [compost metagenome]
MNGILDFEMDDLPQLFVRDIGQLEKTDHDRRAGDDQMDLFGAELIQMKGLLQNPQQNLRFHDFAVHNRSLRQRLHGPLRQNRLFAVGSPDFRKFNITIGDFQSQAGNTWPYPLKVVGDRRHMG